jgi:DNA modification methylase
MSNGAYIPVSVAPDEHLLMRAPEELTPWPRNPRTHSAKQLEKLKASIKEFGFTAPVLTDENGVVLSGHGRLEAARALKLPKIPTRVITGLTEAQKRAYVIADNKLAQLSDWDKKMLKGELEILTKEDFSVELTGFSTAEVDLIFDTVGETETGDPDDELPDIPQDVVSKPGDLWLLGNHKIFCGDALQKQSYAMLLGDEKAQMVITDPPYNVKIDGHVCGNGEVKHKEFAMASGEMSQSEFTAFLNSSASLMHSYAEEGAIVYSFMDWRHMVEIQAAFTPMFGPLRQLCIWAKDNGGMGTFYRSQHELVFIYKKGDVPHINNFELGQHGRYRTNVWEYPGVNTFKGKGYELLALHPTVKPTGLIADAIRDCSHRKGIILDPFAGSGTVLIAAERTSRCARAIELDPQYVDVGVMRWQQLTGKQVVLAATGQTWEQVRAERLQGGQP